MKDEDIRRIIAEYRKYDEIEVNYYIDDFGEVKKKVFSLKDKIDDFALRMFLDKYRNSIINVKGIKRW